MMALSLRQPWAHVVLHYGKTIENRVWNTSFRGEFLIHAAKGMTRDEYEGAEAFVADTLDWTRGGSSAIAERAAFFADFRAHDRRGGFVGKARVVDVIPPCLPRGSLFGECPHRWHIPDQYGFVLEGVEALDFVAYPGSVGFFRVPDAVVAQVLRRSA